MNKDYRESRLLQGVPEIVCHTLDLDEPISIIQEVNFFRKKSTQNRLSIMRMDTSITLEIKQIFIL